jgi:hypothetical protein
VQQHGLRLHRLLQRLGQRCHYGLGVGAPLAPDVVEQQLGDLLV